MMELISSQDALDYVLSHELTPDIASKKLLNAIQRGRIPILAVKLRQNFRDGSEKLLDGQFLNAEWLDGPHFKIDFLVGTITNRGRHSALNAVSWKLEASGIRFSRRHLLNIWSTDAVQSAEVAQPAVNKGGAPAKHDCEKVWLVMLRIVHDCGFPKTQAAMLAKVHDHLGDATPGDTELKKRVSRLWKEFGL